MNTISMLFTAATLFVGFAALPRARADTLTFTLTQPTQNTSTPGVVAYIGTITAPGSNSGAVYLNGDGFMVTGPYAVDDSPFLDAPQTLEPGGTYTGTVFDLDVISPLSLGTFDGTFVLLGGSDGVTQNALSAQQFSLIVTSPLTAVTPEPSSLLLLCTGTLLGIAGLKPWQLYRSVK